MVVEVDGPPHAGSLSPEDPWTPSIRRNVRSHTTRSGRALGELAYRWLGEEQVDGVSCYLLQGRPEQRDLGFDRVELAISAQDGRALRTRCFRRGREFRRVSSSATDFGEFDGRRLPERRRIESPPGRPPLVLELGNAVVEPPLPDSLFTRKSLIVQRFPSF